MGLDIGGFGIPNFIDDAIDKGRDLVQEGKEFGTELVKVGGEKVVETGVEVAGDVFGTAYDLLPDGTADKALGAAEFGIDVVTRPFVRVLGTDNKVGHFLDDISKINLQGATDREGLNGDWGELYKIWFFEQRPDSLGKWDKGVTIDGETFDKVTITDPAFTGDLASRQNQIAATERFHKLYPQPKDGDSITVQWQYTGPGTAEGGTEYHLDETPQENGVYLAHGGHYGAVETFVGSYELTITADVDPVTGVTTLNYTVTNNSVWESGTRIPGTGKDNLGLPDYFVPNQDPASGAHIGGNFQQVYQWSETLPAESPTEVAGGEELPAEQEQPTVESEQVPTGRVDQRLDEQGFETHVVEPGDTIWDLAEQYGVPFEQMLALNSSHIDNPDLIYPGDAIYIPGTAPAGRAAA